MTTDDELRDALHARAAEPPVAAAVPEWTDVPTRARVIHRRRRTFQGAVAAVVVAAATFGLLAVTGAFDGTARRSIVATPPDEQGELVVAFADRVVVMTVDGDTVRTIYEGAEAGSRLPLRGGVSVSADGRYVYFGHYSDACAIRDFHQPGPEIERVQIDDGAEADGHVLRAANRVNGTDPVLSPDGRWLAVANSHSCDPAEQPGPGGVTLLDLRSEVEGGHWSDAVRPLAFTPDSRRLVYQAVDGRIVASNAPAMAAGLEPNSSDNIVAAGTAFGQVTAIVFAPDGSLLAALHAGSEYRVAQPPLESDPTVVPRIAASGAAVASMQLDDIDRLLLVLGDGTLQIQEGSKPPRTIAEGVQGAAWLPRGSPAPTTTTTIAPTTTTAPPAVREGLPARVIAHHADGRVLELEATSGQMLTEITNVPTPPDPTIAVTPDGATIYAERRTDDPDRGCDLLSPLASEIVVIDRASGAVRPFLGTPARWPAVSPDGRFLAYVRIDRCDAPTSLVVRDLVNGDERVWSWPDPEDGGPMPQLRGPLSFGPASSRVLAFVHRGSEVQTWLFETSGAVAEGALRQVPAVPAGPVSPGFRAQRFLGNSGSLGAATFGDVPNIYSLDPESGLPLGQGIVWSSSGSVRGELGWTLVDSDAGARHLLLVVAREDGTHLERVVALAPGDRASSPRTRLGPDGIVAAAWAP